MGGAWGPQALDKIICLVEIASEAGNFNQTYEEF
jgi:hypothetical protein